MKTTTLKELKIKLIEINKTISWLANQMRCSKQYIYQVYAFSRKNPMTDIDKILDQEQKKQEEAVK